MLPEDHPGFSDISYRHRRNKIADIADSYRAGEVVPNVPYINKEHALWELINEKLSALYGTYACREYNTCYEDIPRLYKKQIPQFAEINKFLSLSRFSVSPVSGLVSPRQFLEALADDTMLCTQYIRHHSSPGYTPEPDVIHEILGHCVFFLNDDISNINRLFGMAARNANDEGIERLIRLYWHSVEFGTCYEGSKVKAYGAGLLSSTRELASVGGDTPLRKFNIAEMQDTAYDTMNPQSFLFCGDNFSQIIKDLTEHLKNLL